MPLYIYKVIFSITALSFKVQLQSRHRCHGAGLAVVGSQTGAACSAVVLQMRDYVLHISYMGPWNTSPVSSS